MKFRTKSLTPQDIEMYHWEQFDSNTHFKVLEALQKIFDKDIEVNEHSLRQELDINEIGEKFQRNFVNPLH
jgi:hypothetical protein